MNKKQQVGDVFGGWTPRTAHVNRPDAVRTSDGFSAVVHVSSHRRALRRQSSNSHSDVCRAIPRHGLCATHLPEKSAHRALLGVTKNAVNTQIWIAVSVYMLIAILKKRLCHDASLHTLLQILSVTLFEKTPIQQAFSQIYDGSDAIVPTNQLRLFDF